MELPPGVRERCLQLQEQVRREEGRRFNAFKDEKPALETLIASAWKSQAQSRGEVHVGAAPPAPPLP